MLHAPSLLRLGLLVVPVAVLAGTVSAFFLWSLEEATSARFDHPWLLFALPAAGLLVAFAYQRWGETAERGNNLIIEEIRAPKIGVPGRMVPLVVFGTVITHLAGGSAGREGTAVQIGGGVAGYCSRTFRLAPGETRVLLMAGVAAGFGAVFGTPVAGAVFALEVVAIGRMEYGLLVPALAAAFIADFTATAWGAHHIHYEVLSVDHSGPFPFGLALLAKVTLAGLLFGIASVLFAELTHAVGRFFRWSITNPLLRPVLGGAVVIALVFVFGTRQYLGLGVESPNPADTTIVSSFEVGGAEPGDWLGKIAFTAVTLGSGFKGGEVTPLFYVGSTLGNTLAELLSAPVDLFASLGFVAVFAAAANTPLSSTIMGMELFGAGNTLYMAVACFIAYWVSGRTGIYLAHHIAVPGEVRLARFRPHQVSTIGRYVPWRPRVRTRCED